MVLRDGSARHTLAGAVALDIEPPTRARKRPERIAALECLRGDTPASVLARMLDYWQTPINATRWALAMNLPVSSLLQVVPAGVDRLAVAGDIWLLGDLARAALESRVDDCLAQFHRSDPDEPGLAIERLRRMCAPGLPQAVFRAWAQQAIATGRLGQTGSFVHQPGYRVELGDAERLLWARALPFLINGHFDPPWVRDLARSLDVGEEAMRNVLRKQARQSHLVQVVHDLFYPERTMQEIARVARSLAAQDGVIEVVSFRDALQIGRKRAIQILEACDRLGLTRRLVSNGRNNNGSEKDHRIVRNPDLFASGEL